MKKLIRVFVSELGGTVDVDVWYIADEDPNVIVNARTGHKQLYGLRAKNGKALEAFKMALWRLPVPEGMSRMLAIVK